MNNKTKYFVIGAALLTATAGSVAVFAGQGNCSQGEGGMFGGSHSGQMQNHQRGHMKGQGAMGFRQGIYGLTDLTDEQRVQLSKLWESQQALMRGKRAEMIAQRTQMKARIEAILTDEQRATLSDRDS